MPNFRTLFRIVGVLGVVLLPSALWAQPNPPQYDEVYVNESATGDKGTPAEMASPGSPAWVGVKPICTLLAPFDFSTYRNAAGQRGAFYFGYDRLFMTTSSVDPPAAHVAGGNSSIITAESLESKWGSGNRWEFGYKDASSNGWSASIFDNFSSSQTTFEPPMQAMPAVHGAR
jgi:hypothetical protein